MPEACVAGSATQLLLIRALAPFAVICAMPLIGAFLSLHRGPQASLRVSAARSNRAALAVNGIFNWLPVSLVLTFCFTPSVSALTFRAWHCIGFADALDKEKHFLALDLSVSCDDSHAYNRVLVVAWTLVAIWPVGMVALYVALLIPCRSRLMDAENNTSALVRATAFLHCDYRVE